MKNLPFDHLALRVVDRDAAAPFVELAGYEKVASFDIQLEDGSKAHSYAFKHPIPTNPEIFVSSGPEGSFIHTWVMNRGGTGAVHHLAFAVDDVAATMEEWKAKGVKFRSEAPLICPCEDPLIQVFTEPDPATGLIYELIQRGNHAGFCPENVKKLMDSSPER